LISGSKILTVCHSDTSFSIAPVTGQVPDLFSFFNMTGAGTLEVGVGVGVVSDLPQDARVMVKKTISTKGVIHLHKVTFIMLYDE